MAAVWSTARLAVARELRRALYCLPLMAVAMAVCSTAASAHASGTVTAEFSGTQDFAFVYQPSNPSIWQQHGHFQWDEKLTVRPTPSGAVLVGRPLLTIEGQIVSTYAPPNTARSCTGTFSPRQNIAKASWPLSILGGGDSAQTDVTVGALIPFTGTYTQSTGALGTDCGVPPNGSARIGESPPSDSSTGNFLTPVKNIRLGELPWSKSYRIDYTSPNKDEQTHIRSTLAISGTGAFSPPKQPPTPARYRAKANAARALKDTWERSLYPCIATAAATPLLGLGPAGQLSAAVILPVSGVLCAAYSEAMADETKTIDDPPLRSYDRTATVLVPHAARLSLPACSRWRGSARTLCQRLELRLPKVLAAARSTAAVAAAIETTISRETGAIRARNASAIKRQDRALGALNSRFLTAEANERRAGASVAAAWQAAGVPVTLSSNTSTSAITTVLGRLGLLGVTRRQLMPVLGGALGAHQDNWLRALG